MWYLRIRIWRLRNYFFNLKGLHKFLENQCWKCSQWRLPIKVNSSCETVNVLNFDIKILNKKNNVKPCQMLFKWQHSPQYHTGYTMHINARIKHILLLQGHFFTWPGRRKMSLKIAARAIWSRSSDTCQLTTWDDLSTL